MVVAKLLVWMSALLLAAGLAVAQILLGGWWYPALAAPGYLLVGVAAIVGALVFWRVQDAPGAICMGVTLLFAGYLLWRQSVAPDPYTAREDTWLLLGMLAVYFTMAWHMREEGPRWLVLSVIFLLSLVQVMIAISQFTADASFHPVGQIALHTGLGEGGSRMLGRRLVSGTLESRGSLSSVLQVTSFLALGMLVWGKGRAAVKLLLFTVAAAGFVGLILSTSRSAYVGIPVGVGMFAMVSFFIVRRGALAYRGWFSLGALILVALSLGIALVVGAESSIVQIRLSELGADHYREKMWFLSVPPMLSLNPWLGAGAALFDQLSLRYRGAGFDGRAVHAHNDWLQLLVEYGRVGLLLGLAFFITHLAAGWRNALRMAREMPPAGWLPQGMDLGLTTGALAAAASQGTHALFDYRLHIPAVVLLLGLCAGCLAGTRLDVATRELRPMPNWLRPLAFLLPAITGIWLVWAILHEGPAEYRALQAENAMIRKDPQLAWNLVEEGLALRPANPRLLVLAGESAAQLGNAATDSIERMEWYRRSADDFETVTKLRPHVAYAWRERALALDWYGRPRTALPVHLRAIALEPDNARGYEYLALHYWRMGQPDEAERLLLMAQRLPEATLATGYLNMIAEFRRTQKKP